MNTLEDITVDCGVGNEGAIGVLYASSNCGRIENVTVTAHGGFCGIDFDYGSEACIQNVAVTGFEFGMRTGHTSPLVISWMRKSIWWQTTYQKRNPVTLQQKSGHLKTVDSTNQPSLTAMRKTKHKHLLPVRNDGEIYLYLKYELYVKPRIPFNLNGKVSISGD